MKTILVPVDFSDNSKNAVEYAILLAKKLSMKLLLLHVSPLNEDSDGGKAKMEEELKLWVLAANESGEVKSESLFFQGDLLDEMIQLVREESIEFVVMGTKGASGLEEKFIGSTTAKVIEFLPCPVMAIPADYKYYGFKKIIFATDYHDSDLESLRFLIQLCSLFDSDLKIVHVEDGDLQERFEEDLLAYFTEKVNKVSQYPKMSFHLLNGTDISESLTEFIKDQDADLLALSIRDKLFKGPLFNRSLTRKFVQHSEIPVLAFHAYEDGDWGM